MLVGIYLIASFKCCVAPITETPELPGANVSNFFERDAEPAAKSALLAFASPDDFKSYLDDGKRAYGDGIYELQKNTQTEPMSADKKNTAIKTNIKNIKAEPQVATADEGARYLAMGSFSLTRGGDIIQASANKIIFSPENQFYYSNANDNGITDENPVAGETYIAQSDPSGKLVKAGIISQDGRVVLADNVLAVFGKNLISGFDVNNASSSVPLWALRLQEGVEVKSFKVIGRKLYVAFRSDIDAANPCPIRLFTLGDKPYIVDCAAIYHPDNPIEADSIYSVVEVNPSNGQVARAVSYVSQKTGGAAMIGDNSMYAFWAQGGDHISFFTGFLADKCKSLMPNYLLEKAARLPDYPISLSSKELELRSLISNWMESLSADERARVTAEIDLRMKDYLREHYRDFEQTGVAAADIDSLLFSSRAELAGKIRGDGFIGVNAAGLNVVTASGVDIAPKLQWLLTGKAVSGNQQRPLNNAYLLDGSLKVTGLVEDMEIPAGICAARFFRNAVYAWTCRYEDPIYAIDFISGNKSVLIGKIDIYGAPTYLAPLASGRVLVISKNNRKIKLALWDTSLAAKPVRMAENDLNDYWVDFDVNQAGFSVDEKNSHFFLPAAKGGHVFSYKEGRLELLATGGDKAVSRSFFSASNLYQVSAEGVDVFEGVGWKKSDNLVF